LMMMIMMMGRDVFHFTTNPFHNLTLHLGSGGEAAADVQPLPMLILMPQVMRSITARHSPCFIA
jgi:hypothetical protein